MVLLPVLIQGCLVVTGKVGVEGDHRSANIARRGVEPIGKRTNVSSGR